MDLTAFFATILRSSALSLAGLGNLPLIHQDLVVPGLVTDDQVVQALAIGRLSPGPNGLWVVSLGYLMFGWAGATAALVACALPPLLLLPATDIFRRWLISPWFGGLVRGVTLATAGMLCSTGVTLAAPNLALPAVWQIGVAAAAAGLTLDGRVHPALLVIAGAFAGVVFGAF